MASGAQGTSQSAPDLKIEERSMDARSTRNTYISGYTPGTTEQYNLDNTGYCLLALDGGGVRGLSTLYILRSIMDRLNYMREEAGLQPKKPCEIFDLIGGTSTGGLIAIMLGRLEMTVQECIDAYLRLMTQIFEKRENRSIVGVLGGVKPRFSSAVLKDAISQVITNCGIPLEEKFANSMKPRCKVFVCTNLQSTNTVTRLRSYRTPSSGINFSPTILEAALATSAAPTYFSDISIQGSRFVDGAIGANNPTAILEEEAADLWCEDTGNIQPLVKCFVSIGTGHLGVRNVADKGLKHLLKTLEKEATQTEATNQEFLARWRNHVECGRCYRFNVGHGLEDVKLAEYQQQDRIQAATSSYLDGRQVKVDVRKCVDNLRLKQHHPTVELAKKLVEEARADGDQRPRTLSRATTAEISELISLGNAQLKVPSSRVTKQNLLQARHYFSKALHDLQHIPTTSPKQVARVCQKLLEATLGLSQITRASEERREHAEQAQKYGEIALENVTKCGDECMATQVEFLLACVIAWKMYLLDKNKGAQLDNGADTVAVQLMLLRRLEKLKEYPRLDAGWYEGQVRIYTGYLTGE
ncbi:hypothetical protein ACN47E_005194 [Coniothyrium glycines]